MYCKDIVQKCQFLSIQSNMRKFCNKFGETLTIQVAVKYIPFYLQLRNSKKILSNIDILLDVSIKMLCYLWFLFYLSR